MNNKNVLALIAILVIAIGAYFFPSVRSLGGQSLQVDSFLQGLTAGPRAQFKVSNTGMISSGGTVFATTSTGVTTITASDLIKNGTVSLRCNLTPCTLTMPTKAALAAVSGDFIPNSGDQTTRYIVNSTTTALSTLFVAGNTGMIMQVASSTSAANSGISGITGPAGLLKLEFRRSATSTDIYFTVSAFK
jgi:hypothetical protein